MEEYFDASGEDDWTQEVITNIDLCSLSSQRREVEGAAINGGILMSGGRSRTFRLGDRAELLIEHLLSAIAFTTRVPRQEDIGIDFMCSLITGSHGAGLLKAGPFLSVQAKSSAEAVVYEKAHEREWIMHQENPLLICVADRAASAMDVYSTWNLICAVQRGWQGQAPANCIRRTQNEYETALMIRKKLTGERFWNQSTRSVPSVGSSDRASGI